MLTFSVASNTLVLSNTSLNPIQTEGGFGGGEYRMLPARSLDVYNFCDNQATWTQFGVASHRYILSPSKKICIVGPRKPGNQLREGYFGSLDSRKIQSKNRWVCENPVTRCDTKGSCTLLVMVSCLGRRIYRHE